jgi:hypothetical protein
MAWKQMPSSRVIAIISCSAFKDESELTLTVGDMDKQRWTEVKNTDTQERGAFCQLALGKEAIT